MSAPDQDGESGRGDGRQFGENHPPTATAGEPPHPGNRRTDLREENRRLRARLEARKREREELVTHYERLLDERTAAVETPAERKPETPSYSLRSLVTRLRRWFR